MWGLDSEARVNGEWIYTPNAISVVTAPIVPYQYDPDTDTWIKLDNNLGGNYARPFLMKKMVEQGTLDRKYYDMIVITRDEAEKLELDRNTDKNPGSGYIYNGYEAPGTGKVTITGLGSYTGRALKPVPTVKLNGKTKYYGAWSAAKNVKCK